MVNFAKSWTEEGLHDRAITRDIEWGIELPVDDLGPGQAHLRLVRRGHRLPLGVQEWAAGTDDPTRGAAGGRTDARSFYFVGKDNIPFHCLFWPAQLMGYGDLQPADERAGEPVRHVQGRQGVGEPRRRADDRGGARPLRARRDPFALAASFPEHADTEISEEEIARRINEELVSTWGNLVNRVLSMVNKNCDGEVPDPGELADGDRALLAEVDAALVEAAAQFEAVELKAALRTALAPPRRSTCTSATTSRGRWSSSTSTAVGRSCTPR